MSSQEIESACAFAWRNYLLVHNSVSEDDDRRQALNRYVASLHDRGDCQHEFGLLQTAAVAYLKKLDEFHEEQDARLAADRAVAKCLSRR